MNNYTKISGFKNVSKSFQKRLKNRQKQDRKGNTKKIHPLKNSRNTFSNVGSIILLLSLLIRVIRPGPGRNKSKSENYHTLVHSVHFITTIPL